MKDKGIFKLTFYFGVLGFLVLTIWQPVTAEIKLIADDVESYDFFGGAVAIDGNTLVVGASGHYFSPAIDDNPGSVYVFQQEGGSWILRATLTSNDPTQPDAFGFSVGISGSTVVVGAPRDSEMGDYAGAIYVFEDTSGGLWSSCTSVKITSLDIYTWDYLGYRVAIQGDRIVVGAIFKLWNYGAVYIFERSETTWTQEAKLTASDPSIGAQFGFSVDIYDDTVVVGAHFDDDLGYRAGSAYIFRYSGSAWVQEAKLLASDGEAQKIFGHSVAIHSDFVAVGSPAVGLDMCAVHIFKQIGGNWLEYDKLLPPDDKQGAGDFGVSVAMKDSLLLVGRFGDSFAGFASGSAYLYKINEEEWLFDRKLTASDAREDARYGGAIDLNGEIIVIGAPTQSTNASDLIIEHIAYIEGLGLDGGIEASLITKLNTVNKKMQDGLKLKDKSVTALFRAFMNEVEAQKGKKITEAEAEEIIEKVQVIIDYPEEPIDKWHGAVYVYDISSW